LHICFSEASEFNLFSAAERVVKGRFYFTETNLITN